MDRNRIKSKIKLALKEDMKNRKKTKWDPDTQPNIYQLDLFLRKSGYHLLDVLSHGNVPELIIEPLKESYLTPNIVHQVTEGYFSIEVKKYGELVVSDVEEIMKGYTTAINVVKHLEGLDLSKLEYKEGI